MVSGKVIAAGLVAALPRKALANGCLCHVSQRGFSLRGAGLSLLAQLSHCMGMRGDGHPGPGRLQPLETPQAAIPRRPVDREAAIDIDQRARGCRFTRAHHD